MSTSETPNHHMQVPLRSAMKHRDSSRATSRATSPSASHQSSPTRPPLSLRGLSGPQHSLSPDETFHPRFHSPTLLSQVPLPPSPSGTPGSTLPPTPLGGPGHASLPPLADNADYFGSASLLTPTTASMATPSAHSGASFTPKVSFDTFENPIASMFSYTLRAQAAGFRRTRNTRIYLCAAGPDETGKEALEWLLESLVEDGDELVVFRGVDEENMEKDHDILREEARTLMDEIQARATEIDPDRKLSIIIEYIAGKVTNSIDRLIALYRPDSLVVGTRGKRGIMSNVGFGGVVGSISKYCLSHSPVPVIVVRPGRKLAKALEKRKADPKRGRHFES